MPDITFEVEVTAERLDAARPVFAEVIYRQSRAFAGHPPILWSIAAIVSFVVWWFAIPWLLPEVAPKSRYAIFAAAVVFQMVISVFLVRMMPTPAIRGLARWSAGVIIRRTKKRAPFAVRYRVGDREYRAEIDKLGIVREIQAGDVAVAYRTPQVIILYRRRWSRRPKGIVYLADDEHRRAMDRLLEAGPIVVHDLADTLRTEIGRMKKIQGIAAK